MANWNPRHEWSLLVEETKVRAAEESLNELFGFGKKKDKKDKDDKEEDSDGKEPKVDPEDLGRAEQRTVETWEDLRNLIEIITNKQKAEEIAKKAGEASAAVVKNIAYQIPIVGNVWTLVGTAKDSLGLLNNIMKLPEEEAEKNPLLDTLQLDDGYVDIVDDGMAAEFLSFFADFIEGKSGKIPENLSLEADWNGDGNKTTEKVPTTINSLFQKWVQDHGTEGEETVVGAGSENTFTDIPYPEEKDLGDKAKEAGKVGLKGVKHFLLNMF